MFYSHYLLSSKGHMGAIWLAAYCFKRLKKKQVAETDIPSSVDKILVEEMPSVTYRILAYFLLGVVRIYSKKVEYLFHDCHSVIANMNKYFGKQIISLKKLSCEPQFSIRLPMRYELDAFVLEAVDNASGYNVAQHEDIILQETGSDDRVGVSLEKFEELAVNPEFHDLAHPLAKASMQKRNCLPSQMPVEFSADQGSDSCTHTSPAEVLSIHQLEPDEVTASQHWKLNVDDSMEELRGIKFYNEECIDFEMFCKANFGDLDLNIPPTGPQNPDTEFGYVNEKALSKSHGAAELNEMASTSHDHDAAELMEGASLGEKALGSVVQNCKGAGTPSMAIVTPENVERERVKRPTKRKCIQDSIMVLSNQALKSNLNDASDLVCKRRKVARTSLDLWRFSHIGDLAQNFLKPIIPCIAVEDMDSPCMKKLKIMEPVETSQPPSEPKKIISTRSPDEKSAIAPGTPVLYSMSSRFSRGPKTVDSHGEDQPCSFEDARNEVVTDEVNSSAVDNPEANLMDEEPEQNGVGDGPYVWTEKTRAVAGYLHRSIMRQKQQKGVEAVHLSYLLQSKRKRESARLFYEILVLKCGGFVEVKQKRAYHDILVRETNRMEEALGNC